MSRVYPFIFGSAILTLSTLFSVPATWAAAETPGARERAEKPRMHEMFSHRAPVISMALEHKDELKLTADQISKLEQIRSNYQSQAEPIAQQIRGTEREIGSLLRESPANLVQIKLKIQEAEKFRSELRYLRIEALENGRSVLTPEQRDQLKTLVASRMREFRKSRQQQAS